MEINLRTKVHDSNAPKMRAKDFDARMRGKCTTKRWSLKVLTEFEEPQYQFCSHYIENKEDMYNKDIYNSKPKKTQGKKTNKTTSNWSDGSRQRWRVEDTRQLETTSLSLKSPRTVVVCQS
jgi:hypothetical protein